MAATLNRSRIVLRHTNGEIVKTLLGYTRILGICSPSALIKCVGGWLHTQVRYRSSSGDRHPPAHAATKSRNHAIVQSAKTHSYLHYCPFACPFAASPTCAARTGWPTRSRYSACTVWSNVVKQSCISHSDIQPNRYKSPPENSLHARSRPRSCANQ